MFKKATIEKIIKFGFVGFTGVFVDYAFTYLFRDIIGSNDYIANTIGFGIAATTNFYLNRKWTFKSQNQNIQKEYTIFVGIAIIGLILNNGIIWLLFEHYELLDFYMAKLVAICMVFVWNFTLNNLFNFR